MSSLDVFEIYRSIITQFESIDSWMFQQDVSEYPALLVARMEKIKPVVDWAEQALVRIAPFCEDLPHDVEAQANREIFFGIRTALDVERCIAGYLQRPSQEEELVRLNADLHAKTHYKSAERIYHCLAWRRRTLPTVASVQENGIAAVLRVKNGSVHLRAMLPTLTAYFDEIIFVDHDSTDDTYDYIAGLNHPKIKSFRYFARTAQAGQFYARDRQDGEGSLADYYNFAFDQATAAFVCKWDADMYPLPSLKDLLDQVRKAQVDIVDFTGLDCFGYQSCNHEPRLYRRSLGLRYVDVPFYESLEIKGDNLRRAKLDAPVYLHMKRSPLPEISESNLKSRQVAATKDAKVAV